MNPIVPFDPALADGQAKALLDGVKAKVGAVPNLFRVLAHAPAALDGYLSLGTALSGGRFDATLGGRSRWPSPSATSASTA